MGAAVGELMRVQCLFDVCMFFVVVSLMDLAFCSFLLLLIENINVLYVF